jgi:S-DNA-T family DNA segregation ATPase FtsK/SpoIIIE
VSAGSGRRTGELLHGSQPVGGIDLRHGDVVALETAGPDSATAAHDLGPDADDEAVADLVVVGGMLMGTRVALAPGSYVVGRGPGADVVLGDASLSRRHLRVVVGHDGVEVGDLGSSNGTFLDGVALAAPRRLARGETLEAGRTLLAIEPREDGAAGATSRNGVVPFNRPPRIVRRPDAGPIAVPAPPAGRTPRSLPIGASLIPVATAALMYALTNSPAMLMIGAMTPAMALYSWWEAKRTDDRSVARARKVFERRLDAAEDALAAAHDAEVAALRAAGPEAAELRRRVLDLEPSLWERRPGDEDFLRLRLGVTDLRSAVAVELAPGGDEDARAAVEARLEAGGMLRSVPMLADAGGLAVAGSPADVAAVARCLAVQVAVLHSPAEVAIAAALAPEGAPDWEWLKWLPHTAGGTHLATGPDASRALVERLAEGADSATVLLLDGRLDLDRAAITRLFDAGVQVVWLGADARDAPGGARSIARLDPVRGRLELVRVEDGTTVEDVTPDGITPQAAEELARALAPVRDAAAPEVRGAIPSRVSLLELLDLPDPAPQALLGLWQAPGSDLVAPVGRSADGPFTIDPARPDGLRMLVGGMPGAGKSELLQTMVAALAVRHPPTRLTFLLVDYKGGAAFKDCKALPHTVGMITDLDGHLADRARISLLAEVRRREGLLAAAGARDLAELTRTAPDEAPPAVLIVVDEFGALVREVPAFVDTVVDVAQRGRSLGLHLVLATQRPRGTINDAIRANTNLRLAMRVADAAESQDIIDAPDAAEIPPGLPGRAIALTGRRSGGAPELTELQAGYAGGSSTGVGEVEVHIAPFTLGVPYVRATRVLSMTGVTGPTDLQAIVAAAQAAAERLELAPQPAPWLPPLPGRIDLLDLPPGAIGLVDDPERQRQVPLGFDGHVLVFGGSGSGKTTLLRTVAASLALQAGPAQVQLYALDFASRALGPLEALGNCGSVIAGDDHERVLRLLAGLRRAMAQRRAVLQGGGAPPVPRIVVLLDGYAQFASAFERVAYGEPVQMLQQVATDGPPLGIQLVVTADRRADVPGALAGVIPGRLVLRLADPDEYAALGVPRSAAATVLPPGRGFTREALEIQIATADLEDVALRVAARDGGVHAPRIRAMPARVPADRLPAPQHPLLAYVGIGGDGLEPLAVDLREDHFLVGGPPRSGRSCALAMIVQSLRAGTPGLEAHLLAPRRSPLLDMPGWASVAREPADFHASSGLVVVDDGDELADLPALEPLVHRGRDSGIRVLAAVDVHAALRAYGGWIRDLRNVGRGLLLNPDPDADGELLGVRLPRAPMAPRAPGRGFLVVGGTAEQVQVASCSS